MLSVLIILRIMSINTCLERSRLCENRRIISNIEFVREGYGRSLEHTVYTLCLRPSFLRRIFSHNNCVFFVIKVTKNSNRKMRYLCIRSFKKSIFYFKFDTEYCKMYECLCFLFFYNSIPSCVKCTETHTVEFIYFDIL